MFAFSGSMFLMEDAMSSHSAGRIKASSRDEEPPSKRSMCAGARDAPSCLHSSESSSDVWKNYGSCLTFTVLNDIFIIICLRFKQIIYYFQYIFNLFQKILNYFHTISTSNCINELFKKNNEKRVAADLSQSSKILKFKS